MKYQRLSKGYRIILLWIFAPLALSFVAQTLAMLCGGESTGGDLHGCIIFGTDISELLYAMVMVGMVGGMVTIPTGLPALIILAVIRRIRRRREQAESGN